MTIVKQHKNRRKIETIKRSICQGKNANPSTFFFLSNITKEFEAKKNFNTKA